MSGSTRSEPWDPDISTPRRGARVSAHQGHPASPAIGPQVISEAPRSMGCDHEPAPHQRPRRRAPAARRLPRQRHALPRAVLRLPLGPGLRRLPRARQGRPGLRRLDRRPVRPLRLAPHQGRAHRRAARHGLGLPRRPPPGPPPHRGRRRADRQPGPRPLARRAGRGDRPQRRGDRRRPRRRRGPRPEHRGLRRRHRRHGRRDRHLPRGEPALRRAPGVPARRGRGPPRAHALRRRAALLPRPPGPGAHRGARRHPLAHLADAHRGPRPAARRHERQSRPRPRRHDRASRGRRRASSPGVLRPGRRPRRDLRGGLHLARRPDPASGRARRGHARPGRSVDGVCGLTA